MGKLINFINIEGLVLKEDIPKERLGKTFIYSETQMLFIPENRPKIKSIYEIKVNVKIKDTRVVETPCEKIIALDGTKDFEIIYSGNDKSNTANILVLAEPYNSYCESLPNEKKCSIAEVYILDAYFDKIDERKIYCNMFYLVNVSFENGETP